MSQDKDIQAARVAFEAVYPVPAQCVWVGNGYAATGYNAWDAQTHCHRWEGWMAARRESVSGLLKHECAAPAATFAAQADVDQPVAPTAVRADEVDAKVINAGFDRIESNLDAAADADPHGNSRMVEAGLHDSLPGTGIQAPAPAAQSGKCEYCGSNMGHSRTCPNVDPAALTYEPWGATPVAQAGADARDAARLDFMIERQCWIQWTHRDGSILQCQVYDQDEDEEYHILSGDERYFNTPREAIDAAMKRSGEQKA